MSRPIYNGTLYKKAMNTCEGKAYNIYGAIVQRNKKMNRPRPDFTSREFIGWWMREVKTFVGARPTCGRINHFLGYSWDNIQMQSLSDNVREMLYRTNAGARGKLMNQKKINVFLKDSSVFTGSFSSVVAAAEFFSVERRTIGRLINGISKRSDKINFTLAVSV